MKLTSNQTLTLKRLASMTQPWNPTGLGNRMILAKLVRMGLSQRRYGHPVGWEITEDGRTALSATQTKGE